MPIGGLTLPTREVILSLLQVIRSRELHVRLNTKYLGESESHAPFPRENLLQAYGLAEDGLLAWAEAFSRQQGERPADSDED